MNQWVTVCTKLDIHYLGKKLGFQEKLEISPNIFTNFLIPIYEGRSFGKQRLLLT